MPSGAFSFNLHFAGTPGDAVPGVDGSAGTCCILGTGRVRFWENMFENERKETQELNRLRFTRMTIVFFIGSLYVLGFKWVRVRD